MELHQIRYFLTLCRELNFTRAAETCHVSQPALTKAIKTLEDELGGDLFRRERNNTHLTELGALVKPHLEQVLAATEAARDHAQGFKSAAKAPLKLGVMCTISPQMITGFLRAVREQLPSVEPTIIERPGRQLMDDMLRGEMDVALVGLPSLPERFNAIPLYKERYGVAFARGHRFEAMNAVAIGDLKDERYVQRLACEFDDHFDAAGLEDVPVNIVFRSEREDWVQAILAAGFGCAVMPEFLPRLPGVVMRLLIAPEMTRTVSLVTLAGRQFSPATEAVVRLAKSFRWDVIQG
ncbi:MAG: LysR family transcriptional regulator [Rhodospirillaceae bacterium]|nr:LysR family transcriptional regulator [Rhodospirillaceae bacterium]